MGIPEKLWQKKKKKEAGVGGSVNQRQIGDCDFPRAEFSFAGNLRPILKRFAALPLARTLT